MSKPRNGHTMDGEQKIITVSLPLGKHLDDFVSEICWQAWELAGTQLKAAIALGMRPETFSKKLKLKREQLARSEERQTNDPGAD